MMLAAEAECGRSAHVELTVLEGDPPLEASTDRKERFGVVLWGLSLSKVKNGHARMVLLTINLPPLITCDRDSSGGPCDFSNLCVIPISEGT